MKRILIATVFVLSSWSVSAFAKVDPGTACTPVTKVYSSGGYPCTYIGYTDQCGSNTYQCGTRGSYFLIYALDGNCYGYNTNAFSLPIQLPTRSR